jgi:hypothetical protein
VIRKRISNYTAQAQEMINLSSGIKEFEITDEIRRLGFSRIYVAGKTLLVYNTRREHIQCQYYKDDLPKTISTLRKALTDHAEFDIKIIDKFLVLLSQVWLKPVKDENEADKSASTSQRRILRLADKKVHILRTERKSKPTVSMHDINFLRELGDSNMGIVAQYEISQMYGISVDELETLIRKSEETMN